MSLLKDIRDVLYVILEYFGVPPDMVSVCATLLVSEGSCVCTTVILSAPSCSWFQCGTVSCVVRIAASSA